MTRYRTLMIRGRIVSANRTVDDGVVVISGERIDAVYSIAQWRAAYPDLSDPPHAGTVLPGLVDIHNHGGFGYRFDTVTGAHARAAARAHHAGGSTTVVASVVTGPAAQLVAQTAMLRELVEEGTLGGIHLEGPFLAEARCGAQDPRFIRDPDPELTERLLCAGGGQIRMMTLAPERPGYPAVVQRLTESGVRIALGHTDADYPTFHNALRPSGSGSMVTHLANAMPPLHHRNAGPVAAALVATAAGAVTVELISDGVHLDPGFVALVFAAAPGRVALVSDAMAAAGCADGDYRLGAQPVTVRDGVARTADGSIAGGTSTLWQCVVRAVRESGIPLREAVLAATATPAGALGLSEVGDLRQGQLADLLTVDADLQLRRVLRRGQWLS
ncbi:N-acetylglucosamine-6-phosphate deacetylase [Nocardia sp. 004]|uniref:N-acetylglucosamine-6-phosphate deacetylase n=1 Tax=Nocardia sp. 004 TaxID=3385978 RepID=UPI0039A3BA2A